MLNWGRGLGSIDCLETSEENKVPLGKGEVRRRAPFALLLCVLMAFPCGCLRKPRQDVEQAVDLVPGGVDVIALLDYRKFVNNDVFQHVFDVSEVDRILQRIGLSPENVVRIAGFARIAPGSLIPSESSSAHDAMTAAASPEGNKGDHEPFPGDFGIIVEGEKGFDALLKSLSGSGWVREKHGGNEMLLAQDEPIAVASLRDKMLVTGTPGAVREALDVAQGRLMPSLRAAPGNECGAILRRVGIGDEVSIAISFSQEMKVAAGEVAKSAGILGGMSGGTIVAGLLDVLGTGRGVGLSFAGKKGAIACRVVFVARDAGSAKFLVGLVKIARIVVPRIGELGGAAADAAELSRGVDVWSENNLVLVDFRIPESVLPANLHGPGGDEGPQQKASETEI